MDNTQLIYFVFSVAQPMPPEDRKAYLQSVERLHPEVSRTVHRLLAPTPPALDFIDRFSLHVTPDVAPIQEPSLPPHIENSTIGVQESTVPRVGSYRILEVLGEGGMGIVYAAEQESPVRRKVAIKLIKPGMDSRQIIARFEAERQALAMMDHPNIAKVFEAGATNEGHPYFVMELVRGLPFHTYCDERRLPLRKRLELLKDACEAIQHAHNKGIIHRDIKPSNVLVTDSEQGPLIKVIDFGVAKAISLDLTDKTVLTLGFQVIGSPLYASPEQWNSLRDSVDTRSDVYSLGVMLYETLCGQLPLDRKTFVECDFEQLRIAMSDMEPQRPSRRLNCGLLEAEAVAAARSTNAADLRRDLSAELDWIAMRAIQIDLKQRYQSPRDLGADISRYLRGDEVEACPPSWLYRTGKMLRRHARMVIAGILFAATLLTSTMVALDLAAKADHARRLAIDSKATAERKANALAELMYSRDTVAATNRFLSGDNHSFRELLRRHENYGDDGREPAGFEWHWLNSLRAVRHRTLYECTERINAIALSPQKSLLALGNSNGEIIVLERKSRAVRDFIRSPQEEVMDVVFLGEHRVASCGGDGTVAVFQLHPTDPESASLVRHTQISNQRLSVIDAGLDAEDFYVGGEDGVLYRVTVDDHDSAVSIAGKFPVRIDSLQVLNRHHFAVGLKNGEIVFLSKASDSADPTYWSYAPERPMDGARDLAASAMCEYVACSHLQGLVTLLKFDLTSGSAAWQHESMKVNVQLLLPADIHSIAVDAAGNTVIAGDSLGNLHQIPGQSSDNLGFLDPHTARQRRIQSWQAHEGKIEDVLLLETPDSQSGAYEILSVGRDGKLVLSEPSSAMPIELCSDVDQPETARLVAGRTRLERLPSVGADEHRDRLLWQSSGDAFAVRFAIDPQQRHVALCVESPSPRRHHLEIYSLEDKRLLRRLDWNFANDMTYSPDGRILAAVLNNDIALIDTFDKHPTTFLVGHGDAIRDIAFSPDGTSLASVSNDQSLIVWDVGTRKQLWTRRAHGNRATGVAFHPTRPTIATVGIDAMLRFWRSEPAGISDDARLVGEFPLPAGDCRKIWFSKDGDSLTVSHGKYGYSRLAIEKYYAR
jgi:serine/threonine protein kinase/WD40 repeat protein